MSDDEQTTTEAGSVDNAIFETGVSAADVSALFSSVPPPIVAAPPPPPPRTTPKKTTSVPVKSQQKGDDNESHREHGHVCSSPNCKQPASMACPTCVELDLPKTRFCTQECFKQAWPVHRAVHDDARRKAKDQALFLRVMPNFVGMTDIQVVADLINDTWMTKVFPLVKPPISFEEAMKRFSYETLVISVEKHGTCRNRLTRCDKCKSHFADKLVMWLSYDETKDDGPMTVVAPPSFG